MFSAWLRNLNGTNFGRLKRDLCTVRAVHRQKTTTDPGGDTDARRQWAPDQTSDPHRRPRHEFRENFRRMWAVINGGHISVRPHFRAPIPSGEPGDQKKDMPVAWERRPGKTSVFQAVNEVWCRPVLRQTKFLTRKLNSGDQSVNVFHSVIGRKTCSRRRRDS